ncbi:MULTISPECIES: energy transducer TonB [Chryseobacterium]|uniref:energy transducer TonB n=1 Tax=Chryseobacterium TaxID=59732 RepID=UPI0016262455|nr:MULTISPECIES: energy transducer TonB [Chryseobacterium]MDM1553913.1 energy transducer TonB [Chryseobacterium indologenes]
MKKIIFLLFTLGFTLCFSQAKQDRTEFPVKDYTNEADIKPEFPGGISAFKTLIMSKLNFSIITDSANTEVKFLIDSKGELSSVTANGEQESFNKEVIQIIKTINKKWEPAVYKSKPVDYWYTLPISINFD